MGTETIRLRNEAQRADGAKAQDLARISFSEYQVPAPAMAISVMTAAPGQPVFPWWNYEARVDEEIHRLNQMWAVTSDQSLFDLIFLAGLKQAAGADVYVIFPGNLRTEGWKDLSENAKSTLTRGQGCVYRLEASFSGKMAINWVPFYQPQGVVKAPAFESLWRLFVAARSEDVANSISFFSLKDTRRLPQVANLLIQPDDKRSEKMAELTDWFGVYSSPVHPNYGAAAVFYAKDIASLGFYKQYQARFSSVIDQVRKELLAEPGPATALRLVSRLVAL